MCGDSNRVKMITRGGQGVVWFRVEGTFYLGDKFGRCMA